MNLAVYYGYVELYAAKGRQPSRSDYDRSNIRSGDPDFLSVVSVYYFSGKLLFTSNFQIDSTNQGQAGQMNILIMAVGGPASFTALITSPTAVNQLIPGLPQMLHLYPNQLHQFTALLSKKDNTTITVTTLNADTPRLQAALPSNPSNIMRSNDGFINFVPSASDVNKQVQFQVISPNASVISVIVHEAVYFDIRPAGLMSGVPQNDVTTAHSSHYYYFTVPPGIDTDVKIMVTSLEVSCSSIEFV